jgi:hypothetical protein
MNINNITDDNEIWVEMGQFSAEGKVLGDTKNLKIGDKVKVSTVSDSIEECTLYEYGEFQVKAPRDKDNFVFWAIPTSDWWRD